MEIVKRQEWRTEERVASFLRRCYVITGVSITSERVEVFTAAVEYVLNSLYKEFNMFCEKDFQKSIEKGLRGDYGEYHGLNAMTFYRFMDLYKKNNYTEPENKLEEPINKPSDAQVLQSFIDSYKSGNELIFSVSWVIYDLLVSEGKIDENAYKDNEEQAKKELINEKQKSINDTQFHCDRMNIRELIERISQNAENDRVNDYAKELFVMKYFKENYSTKNK